MCDCSYCTITLSIVLQHIAIEAWRDRRKRYHRKPAESDVLRAWFLGPDSSDDDATDIDDVVGPDPIDDDGTGD